MLPQKLNILFLCTGNSCRSQMAEGWTRALHSQAIQPWSAGIRAAGLNPLAVRAMDEVGIDIRSQYSKTIEALKDESFDLVITVCGHAQETCPAWVGNRARMIHVGFDDPPQLARTARDEQEAMVHYRRVRDQIGDFIKTLPRLIADMSVNTKEITP